MKIAIPTHRRHNLINKLTLSLLKDIDSKDIFIFISDKQDMKLYSKECKGYNLILCNTNNATDKFNYIQNYFEGGGYICVIEDDIKKIQSLLTNDIKKLLAFIESYCQKNLIYAFGVYPSSNKFFMSKSIEIGLTYIVANLYGFKANKDQRLLCRLPSKTDYERSALYYKMKGDIARFNFISCLTSNYKTKGGMQEMDNRVGAERVASNMLCKLFPDIYSINNKRKSMYTEVKMKKIIRKQTL
ncbi:MAG: hypothetical protein O2887_10255 [Bacteroidetes bacterium]|nr:hypothetical protein [Bacteroidota bacterium]